MAQNQKHMLGQKAEQYSDYLLFLAGVIGFAGLVGAITITIFPAYSASGLVDLQSVVYSFSGTDILLGSVIASGAGALAYGTNQTVDAALDVQNSWKETEAGAAIVVVALPIAYTFVGALSSAATGDYAVQALFVGVYGAAFSHLVDL